jgi:hypothetical protein
MASDRVSVLSKERLAYPVTAYVAGKPYDPTSAGLEFAFITDADSEPAIGDWHPGTWDVNLVGGYVALVLIGPGTNFALPTEDYYVWIRITDATLGETPVRQISRLIVY